MPQRSRKLVTYGRSMKGQSQSLSAKPSDTTLPGNLEGEHSDFKTPHCLIQSPLPRSKYSDHISSVARAHSLPLKPSSSSSDASIYDIPSSSDGQETRAFTHKRRRKNGLPKLKESPERPSANDNIDPTASSGGFQAIATEHTLDKTGRGKRYTRQLGKEHDRFEASSSAAIQPRPVSVYRRDQNASEEVRRQNDFSNFQRQPRHPSLTCCSKSDLGSLSSYFTSNTGIQQGTSTYNRRRLVDSLGVNEQPHKEVSPEFDPGDHSNASISPCSSNNADLSQPPGISQKSLRNEAPDLNNSGNSTALQSSHLGGSRITYARQRSFLDDLPLSSEIPTQEAIPLVSTEQYGTDHAKLGAVSSCHIPLSLGDEDDNGSGSVQSIHELRKAGENSRFRGAVESVFEDIEDVNNSRSGRCYALIQFCSNLMDPEYAHRFAECGFDKRLIENLTNHLDAIPATLALCASELIRLHGFLPSAILTPFWPRILDLSLMLLDVEDDLLLLIRNPSRGLSRATKAAFQDIFQRLRSALFGEQYSSIISPRLMTLRFLRSNLPKSREGSDSLDNITVALIARLVNLLILENRPPDRSLPFSSERFQLFDLTFPILETYTVLSGSLADAYRDSIRPLSRLHNLLHLKECDNNQNRRILVSYVRLILNVTNNNSTLCNDFATTGIVGGLVRIVVERFNDVSEDSFAHANESLDIVILALGALVNLTEGSESSRRVFIQSGLHSESFLHSLLNLFSSNICSISEAHSVLKIHNKVAIGYLSILLTILCLDVDTRSRVNAALNGRGLTLILSTVDEFLHYHDKVEQGLQTLDAKGTELTGLTARLQHIVAQVQ